MTVLPEWSAAFLGEGPAVRPACRCRRSGASGPGEGRPAPGSRSPWSTAGWTPPTRGRDVAGAVAIEPDAEAEDGYRAVEGDHEDLYGHGTACAGIIRALAPEAEIYSVRVLGSNLKGKTSAFYGGIAWAVENGMQVVNMSLSSKSDQWYAALHEVVDEAYFADVMLVCAANNMPGPTYPSQFASVFSVAALGGQDPEALAYNTSPPVEFGARGLDLDVAWTGGTTINASGNSFATPHVAGMAARILSKHPGLTPFQMKAVLHAVANNAD